MTKTRFIPDGFIRFMPTLTGYENTLFECYVNRDDAKPVAIFYAGKSNKPLFYNRFMTLDSMKKKILDTISNLMARADAVAKRKAERSTPSTLKVGAILYTSWGYDQTNINFYQVTKTIGVRTVEVREIASKTVDSSGSADYVVAVKDAFLMPRYATDTKTGAPMKKLVRDGNIINIHSFATAWLWDGQPKYETALGWGH